MRGRTIYPAGQVSGWNLCRRSCPVPEGTCDFMNPKAEIQGQRKEIIEVQVILPNTFCQNPCFLKAYQTREAKRLKLKTH